MTMFKVKHCYKIVQMCLEISLCKLMIFLDVSLLSDPSKYKIRSLVISLHKFTLQVLTHAALSMWNFVPICEKCDWQALKGCGC